MGGTLGLNLRSWPLVVVGGGVQHTFRERGENREPMEAF